MKRKLWPVGAIGGLALGLLASPAQAAPAGGIAGLNLAGGPSSGVEQVHRRYYRYHRYYDDGYRYRRHYRPHFHFYYGPRRHHRHRYYRHDHW